MNFKKLKLATGIIGLVGVVLAVVCYIVSFVIASQYEGEELLAAVVAFVVFSFPLGFVCLVELVFSILYILRKFKSRVFYVVGAVLSILDLFICSVLIYFAIIITFAIGGFAVPLIAALCALPVVATIILKILCAVKFKPDEIKDNKD
ncbi:MAG: hypothetical protein ACI4MC_06785 [Candidatus Coproplasma sp.]